MGARINGITKVGWAAVAYCLAASGAGAQVRVLPRTSLPDATENYVLQVANDHQVAVTRIELRIPRSVKIMSLGERSDWPAQILKEPSGVIALVWTGALSQGRYTELAFIARNPAANVRVVWPAILTYANGETVLWWSGKSSTKAPVTLISAPPDRRGIAFALAVCLSALVLALMALAVAIRSGKGGGEATLHSEAT